MGRTKGRANGEGTVYEYPKGTRKWWVEFTLPDDTRIKRRVSSQREGQKLLQRLREEHNQGLNIAARPVTIEEFSMTWLEAYIKPHKDESTYVSYGYVFKRYINPHIGRRIIRELMPLDVQQWINTLSNDGYSPSTIHNARRRLRGMLDKAVQNRLVGFNAAASLELPKIKKPRRALDLDAARRFLRLIEELI